MTKRILIFIVAYNHEKTIQKVLSRIPESVLNAGAEVLIIDDSSKDRTFARSVDYLNVSKRDIPLTVLYNPINLGYGGNQKVGFRYAIENDFDIVALVHGDGQYAPERLPDLLEPFDRDNPPDAVFGSRLINRSQALRGGMPLYKYIGNRILTCFQNTVLNSQFSEFHSGYRLYSISALKRVPFQLNTNEFHFDTEIIIQFLLAGLRIEERAIPTYYGDEICYVNGLKYAKDVVKVTMLAPLQRMGLLYNPRYAIDEKGTLYGSKLGFNSSHTAAINLVRPGSSVLDFGCASGVVARELQKIGCRVTGVDAVPAADMSVFEAFHVADLNCETLPVDPAEFDYVLMLDVVEHLKTPEAFISMLYDRLGGARGTQLIVSTGNVAFFVVRFMLLFGMFNYGRRGILDLTHTRLFTFASLRRLFQDHGFDVTETQGIPAPFPLAFGDNVFSRMVLRFNAVLIRPFRGIMSYQILMRLNARPSLPWLLDQARAAGQKKYEARESQSMS